MSQQTSTDYLNADENDPQVLSSGLKILTVLTIIWCIISGLLVACTSVINDFFLRMLDKAAASGKDFSAKEIADMDKARAAIELSKQNMIPMMIVAFAGIALCFVGALWMRKLKKDGFWLYVVGELAPIIATFFIMGTAQFTSIFAIVLGVVIPVVFVILYSLQRKNLKY